MARKHIKLDPVPPCMGIINETIVRFIDADTLPGNPTQSQLQCWTVNGIRSVLGKRPCYLEWCKVGGSRCTSREAYIRFMEAINS